eukprot:Nitzschia sp. Nitz4//scaffold120_size68122//16446//17228//NITZ4_006039-RA/size68122-processed-gene-0.46-mRNA-1//-1//CDS//3329534263//7331//frame0
MDESRRWMAGHSKWANIRHKKGAKDKARAAILGKASLGITAASKACGGDMTNLRLQSAVAHAKSVQLPKDRIDDAIAKGTSKGGDSDADLLNLRFDAMLNLNGTKVACIVTALTDNRNRTTSSVRHLVTKDGAGELLTTDSLSYVFQHVGQIVVENVKDEDSLMECALDAGATNIEQDTNEDGEETTTYTVTTEDTDLFQVVTSLRDGEFDVTEFEHRYILLDEEHGGVELPSESEDALINFLDKMDENEDVSNVYHNAA